MIQNFLLSPPKLTIPEYASTSLLKMRMVLVSRTSYNFFLPFRYGCTLQIDRPLKDKLLLQGPKQGNLTVKDPHSHISFSVGVTQKKVMPKKRTDRGREVQTATQTKISFSALKNQPTPPQGAGYDN